MPKTVSERGGGEIGYGKKSGLSMRGIHKKF